MKRIVGWLLVLAMLISFAGIGGAEEVPPPVTQIGRPEDSRLMETRYG